MVAVFVVVVRVWVTLLVSQNGCHDYICDQNTDSDIPTCFRIPVNICFEHKVYFPYQSINSPSHPSISHADLFLVISTPYHMKNFPKHHEILYDSKLSTNFLHPQENNLDERLICLATCMILVASFNRFLISKILGNDELFIIFFFFL